MIENSGCGAAPRTSRPKKAVLFATGSVSLGLGVAGIALPLLPTTPFLLLAAACYLRSSDRMYRWMLCNRIFGGHLSNYRAGRGMTMRAKAVTLVMLWAAIGYSAYLMGSIFWQMILLAIAATVTAHILTLATFRG